MVNIIEITEFEAPGSHLGTEFSGSFVYFRKYNLVKYKSEG